jgi:hypothetical protein
MYLELTELVRGRPTDVVVEIFYWGQHRRMTVTGFRPDIPLGVLEYCDVSVLLQDSWPGLLYADHGRISRLCLVPAAKKDSLDAIDLDGDRHYGLFCRYTISLVFHGESRYHFPIMPLIIISACAGVATVLRSRREEVRGKHSSDSTSPDRNVDIRS